MPLYQRGSKGEEVEKIQSKLKDLDYYLGPIDGIFGGGTEAAVRKFQTNKELLVDGKVGEKTWAALFDDEEIVDPDIVDKGLDYRCLALTGSFETGKPVPECFSGLTGDFDDQGISFGALQWNFGQRSLQPLLKEMNESHREILRDIFHTEYEILVQIMESEYEEQMEWARSIQDPVRHFIHEPWRGLFKALGRTKEYQEIQVRYTKEYYQLAKGWLGSYGLWSERAEALLFDIRVQNGSIQNYVKAQILRDFEELDQELDKNNEEIAKLRIIANRRAEASNPRWVEDVRWRKLCIANGEGIVHGNFYHLESQYGIRLKEAV